ncbi:MAG: GDSL-type esterase/lipase family protein [Candidatus Electrothrix sp. GW3-4]|uniref:GDSL-type esterase/lipase family protein n=1 Tax=Candidatus Electrothrix sp. GW3-4 TaxID=3126740 RepID=UPI0030D255CD
MTTQTALTGKTLLMLGDSLIEWGDWEPLLPDLQVINRGVAGEHTEELSARLINEIDAVVDAGPEPEYILLMTGTNNLLMGSPYFPVILGSMLPRLVALCPQSRITLNSLMPMRIQGLAEETITAANTELRDVAQRSACRFLDMTTPFTEQCLPVTKPCFLNDGVHLATRGYQVWAGAIKRHLEALEENQPMDHETS